MKRLTRWTVATAAVLALAIESAPARAGITGADFHEILDLPDYGSVGPRFLENLGVVLPSAGPQLTGANEISNPSGWADELDVRFDSTTNVLSLTADANDAYQIITITLDNLKFDSNEVVAGITPLVTNSAVTEDFGPYMILTSFTPTSFSVTYTVNLGSGDVFDISPPPALDQFQISLSANAIPEPGSPVLLASAAILGAATCLLRSRGRRSSLVGDRPWRIASATAALARSAVPIVGVLIGATSASAGEVFQTVSSLLPGGFGVNQTNVSVSSLPASVLVQPNGDEAYSSVVLNGPGGMATLNGHACSGPADGGNANSDGTMSYQNSYIITSSTLPIGSLVFISLVADGARRETVQLDIDKGSESVSDTSGVSGEAHITFALPGATYAFAGTFNHGKTPFDPEYKTKTGLFDGEDTQQLLTVVGGTVQHGVVAAHVGDFINVGVSAQLIAGSGAIPGVVADVDGQIALNWGIHPFDSQIEIVSVPGERAPDNNDLSVIDVIAGLPPRPDTVDGSVPEPTTFLLLGEVLAAGSCGAWWRHRRSRSSRTGSGDC